MGRMTDVGTYFIALHPLFSPPGTDCQVAHNNIVRNTNWHLPPFPFLCMYRHEGRKYQHVFVDVWNICLEPLPWCSGVTSPGTQVTFASHLCTELRLKDNRGIDRYPCMYGICDYFNVITVQLVLSFNQWQFNWINHTYGNLFKWFNFVKTKVLILFVGPCFMFCLRAMMA